MTKLASTVALCLFILGVYYFLQENCSNPVNTSKSKTNSIPEPLKGKTMASLEKAGVNVVVAKVPIKSGQKVTREMLRMKWVEKSNSPSTCAIAPQILVDKYAIIDLKKDQIIRYGDIGVPKEHLNEFVP